MRCILPVVLALALFPALACADTPAAPATTAAARPSLQVLYKQVLADFSAKDYPAAEKSARAFLERVPNQPDMLYNLACAQAQQNKLDDALATLERAVAAGLSTGAHMEKDADLAALHENRKWAGLLATVKANEAAGGPYEKGIDLPKLKTVEEKPEGGLPFRLRMSPKATAERPNKLILWLHPSGGSGNRLVEAMADDLVAQGYALAVLPQKSFVGWSNADGEKLINKTLPAIARVPGIDARRPLLFGFSAGGQMALEMWNARPSLFGGLILDAAYPIEARDRAYVLRDLPRDRDAIKTTPVFVLVGEKDGGLAFWKKAQPEWTAAGVAVTLHTLPDAGHAWLFGAEQKKLLLAWLAAREEPAATGPASR